MWKSLRWSDKSNETPPTYANSLAMFLKNIRIRARMKFDVQCLNQDKDKNIQKNKVNIHFFMKEICGHISIVTLY